MKKEITIDLTSLMVLFMPHYWMMNHPYHPKLDQELNDNIDKVERGEVKPSLSRFHIYIGEKRYWISNYPYAYAERGGFRPSRATIFRLRNLEKKIRLEEWE